jgi:hypothetical protein
MPSKTMLLLASRNPRKEEKKKRKKGLKLWHIDKNSSFNISQPPNSSSVFLFIHNGDSSLHWEHNRKPGICQ